MNELLSQFNKARTGEDFFLWWEQELQLRKETRAWEGSLKGILVEEPESLDFLLRSLYYAGRKNDFFTILFENMHSMTVVDWLLNNPREVLIQFLRFLPFYILNYLPRPRQLQFLISIYQTELREHFINIINVLDLDTCNYLLARTANPELRQLFKSRQLVLVEQKNVLHYGLIQETSHKTFSTFYGDKLQLFIEAIKAIRASSAANFRDPYSNERFNVLLDAAAIIFQAGLIEDCLVVLLDIYEDYLDKNRRVNLNQEELFYNRMNKLLRRVVPMYALLTRPARPYPYAQVLYKQGFNLFSPEPASLHYLSILETILDCSRDFQGHGLYEVMGKTNYLLPYRPQDAFIINQEEIAAGFEEGRLQALLQSARERMLALPHEALVIMEFLRLLIKLDYQASKKLATNLLSSYIELWKWVPGRLFINQPLLDDLGPLTAAATRHEAERINAGIENFNLEQLLDDFNVKPDLFRKKEGKTRMEILTGKFMGVL